MCGNVFCTQNESCVYEECVEIEPLCGDTQCNKLESCIDNRCQEILTFSTFNLYNLVLPDSYHYLARFIWKYNIGIMVTQEIQREDAEPLIAELKKYGIDVNIEFSSYGGYAGDNGYIYLAIISRYPLTEVETIIDGTYQDPISQEYYEYNNMRPVLKVKLSINNKDLTIYDLHLKAQYPIYDCDSCLYKRRAQAHALEEYIKNNSDPEIDNIIVAGDMNTALEDDFFEKNTLDMLTLKSDNPEIQDNDFLPVNYTYKRDEPTHTRYYSILDHIILSPSLLKKYQEDSIEIVTPKGRPSDHRAVILRLDLNQ